MYHNFEMDNEYKTIIPLLRKFKNTTFVSNFEVDNEHKTIVSLLRKFKDTTFAWQFWNYQLKR